MAHYLSAMRIPQNIDDTLSQNDVGVDIALQRAKSWSKYVKDIMTYIDRKAHFEAEFAKNIARLANSMRPAICEEGFLPLQDEYFKLLENDLALSNTYQHSTSSVLAEKFIEPLSSRRNDHEKVRKSLKDQWNKEMKRMEQAVNGLKNSKSLYIQRRQEYERACELSQKTESEMLGQSGGTASTKLEKRRKAEEDAIHKAAEAETTYKACVAEANMRQVEMARIKREVLARLHEQIIFGDKVLKKVTQDYFHLEYSTNSPVPKKYYDLYERCDLYESGSQYAQFVSHLPPNTLSPVFSDHFTFEPYQSDRNANRKTSNHSTSSLGSASHSYNNSPLTTNKGQHRPLVRAWSHSMGSDSESASGSSNKSMDSSPSASPLADLKVARHSMSDVVEEDNLNDSGIGTDQTNAKAKRESSDFVGICKRLGNRRGTFGVDFSEQVLSLHTNVPPIVTQCLLEVELRGLTTKGIYRVSGVKSKVEALCQKFEMAGGRVDLREDNPVVVSNVLKLYLRQLPEPLLTFALYMEFIRIAKEDMSGNVQPAVTIESLNDLVSHLPLSNFHTCAVLMHHLKRVTHHVEDNQMNAYNLGIVFGPTLLRPREGPTSLTALVDTPHQTRAVEMLVSAADRVFGPCDIFSLSDCVATTTTKAPPDTVAAHAPLTQSYTDTLSDPPATGHRVLRRSSSTPIGEVTLKPLSSPKMESGTTQTGDVHPDTDEMRDMVIRRGFEAHRLRSAERTVSADDKPPEDQRSRLAKSLEIKAKFLLGNEGQLRPADDIVIDKNNLKEPADTGQAKLDTSPIDTGRVRSARPLSASISEARAKFLLGEAADDADGQASVLPDARANSSSPDLRVEGAATPTVSSPSCTARFTPVRPRYYESEACESSLLVSQPKCILTVPRPYPGLSSSPTPAPKLCLPPGALTPMHSRTPSPSCSPRPIPRQSHTRHSGGNVRAGTRARRPAHVEDDDDDRFSDDDISYV